RLSTLAAAWGRRFSVYELAEMARMPVAALLDPIKELVQADILIESGDRLAFGHDLIREAIRASSPVPVRRALDRQAADVLLARGALPVEAAQQLADRAQPRDHTPNPTFLPAAPGQRGARRRNRHRHFAASRRHPGDDGPWNCRRACWPGAGACLGTSSA